MNSVPTTTAVTKPEPFEIIVDHVDEVDTATALFPDGSEMSIGIPEKCWKCHGGRGCTVQEMLRPKCRGMKPPKPGEPRWEAYKALLRRVGPEQLLYHWEFQLSVAMDRFREYLEFFETVARCDGDPEFADWVEAGRTCFAQDISFDPVKRAEALDSSEHSAAFDVFCRDLPGCQSSGAGTGGAAS